MAGPASVEVFTTGAGGEGKREKGEGVPLHKLLGLGQVFAKDFI